MKELINKYNTVCWYPSAGFDLNSIKFWFEGLENKLKPDLFIFTDLAYDFENIQNQFMTNGTDNLYNEFQLQESNDELPIPIDNQFYGPYPHLFDNSTAPSEFNLETKKMKDRLFELGLNELFIPSSASNSKYIYLKRGELGLILLATSNEGFYEYCEKNNIDVNCIMLFRPNDQFCENDVERRAKKNLNLKEGIVNNKYARFEMPDLKIKNSSLFWDTVFSNLNHNGQPEEVEYIDYNIALLKN